MLDIDRHLDDFENVAYIHIEDDFGIINIWWVDYNLLLDNTIYKLLTIINFTRWFAPSGVYTWTTTILCDITLIHTLSSVNNFWYWDSTYRFGRMFVRRLMLQWDATSHLFSSNPLAPTLMNTFNQQDWEWSGMNYWTLNATSIIRNINLLSQKSTLDWLVTWLQFTDIFWIFSVGSLIWQPFWWSQISIRWGTAWGVSIQKMSMIPAWWDTVFDFTWMFTPVNLTTVSHFTLLWSGGMYASWSPNSTDPLISSFDPVWNNNPPSNIIAEARHNVVAWPIEIDIPLVDAIILSLVPWWDVSNQERFIVSTEWIAEYTWLDRSSIRIDRNMKIDPKNSTKTLWTIEIYLPPTEFPVTFTNWTNIINEILHWRINWDNISFIDTVWTLPTWIRNDAIYYVVNANVDDFQVSYTLWWAVVTFSDDWVAPNSYKLAEVESSQPFEPITANLPKVISCIADYLFDTWWKSLIAVTNKSDDRNIEIHTWGYLRI